MDLEIDKVAMGMLFILQGLRDDYGLDIDGDNFVDTPARVSRAYKQIFGGLQDTDGQVKAILKTAFPCEDSSGMVVVRDIRTFSMCPHHFLPVEYKVHVAYVPQKGGRVLGLSKLPRIVDLLARRPVLQEQFTADVTKHLMCIPGVIGAACTAEGRHFCMTMRGAQQPTAITTTSSLLGVFMDEPEARAEFLSLARK